MADTVKVLIGEKNGVELESEEFLLVPENIPFSSSNFSATDVKAALEEVKASSSDHFSYDRITPGQTVTVPLYQQMLVWKELIIDLTGELVLEGTLVMVD
jgi:hypothetical protein